MRGVLLWMLIGLWPLAGGAADDASRAAFAAAFAATDEVLNADTRRALRDYPLYPYLQAQRLRDQLRKVQNPAVDSLIQDFLAEHGDAPYTQGLRRQWWDSLYTRKQYADFLRALPARPDQPLLLCRWLAAHLALERTGNLMADAMTAWHTGRSMPAACDGAFDWLRARGALGADVVAARLRLALDAGELNLARYLTGELPESRQRIWTNARLAREQRGSFLERLVDAPEAPIFFTDLRAGLYAHARRDLDGAVRLLDRLIATRALDASERDALIRAVALPAAWSRDARALALLNRTDLAGHDELAFEWHARSALWGGDWQTVARVIDAMPPAMAAHARWRYWAARSYVALGEINAASAYAQLAADRSFYGFLAAERAGVPPRLAARATPVDADAQTQLRSLPAVQRAREWYALTSDRRAVAELQWAFAELDADGLEQAALMLADWGWHHQAIAWLARSRRWDDLELRFPLPQPKLFETVAAEAGIPVAWLHTIVRTESLYDPRAVSGAGARGMAQVMPATARKVARTHDIDLDTPDALFDPAVNLRLGARYLAALRARFAEDDDAADGRWLYVVPSYNAGPGRIPGWLPDDAPRDADIWVENIPFNETRDYVQRALYHYLIIHWRLHDVPGRILPLLAAPVVPAREPLKAD